MKKYMVVLAAMVMVVALAGSAWAAGTATNTVTTTATVNTMCKNGTAGTLTFPGPIDPSSGANVAASTTGLTYKCSTGTPFKITSITGGTGGVGGVSAGTCAGFTGLMQDGGGSGPDVLNYTLACGGLGAGPYTGLGFGAGTAVSIVLNGTITPAQFQIANPGAYTDTVTVTVTN